MWRQNVGLQTGRLIKGIRSDKLPHLYEPYMLKTQDTIKE